MTAYWVGKMGGRVVYVCVGGCKRGKGERGKSKIWGKKEENEIKVGEDKKWGES